MNDLQALAQRSENFEREFKVLLGRRINKCKSGKARQIEATVQFLYARALAEDLAKVVVTEGNEEFLRELIDNQPDRTAWIPRGVI